MLLVYPKLLKTLLVLPGMSKPSEDHDIEKEPIS